MINESFWELMTMVDVSINQSGEAKREALLAPESQWNGIDAWLET